MLNSLPEYKQHQMIHTSTYPDGSDEFYCPICGRRVLVHWPPAYKKTVLEPGNEIAIHSGGRNGVQVDTFEIIPVIETDVSDASQEDHPEDAAYLAQWELWLDRAGFEQWWERDI